MASQEVKLFQAQAGTFEQLTVDPKRLFGDENTPACLDAILLPYKKQPTARIALRLSEDPSQRDSWHQLYSFEIRRNNIIVLATYQGSHYINSPYSKTHQIKPLPSFVRILALARRTIATNGHIPELLLQILEIHPTHPIPKNWIFCQSEF